MCTLRTACVNKAGTFALLWLIVALAACSERKQVEPPPTATSVSEQAALAGAASAVRSFGATFTVEVPGMPVERGALGIAFPDRSSFTVIGSESTMAVEMTFVGSERYSKRGDIWIRLTLPGPGVPRVLTQAGDQLRAFATGTAAGTLTKAGSDMVDGRSCQIYGQTLTEFALEFCVAEKLPLRTKLTLPSGTRVTYFFADYDKELDIKAPI